MGNSKMASVNEFRMVGDGSFTSQRGVLPEERRNDMRMFTESKLEKAVAFIELYNIEAGLRALGRRLDPFRFRDYLSEGRHLLEAFVYMGIDPRQVEEGEAKARSLRSGGFIVRSKLAKFVENGKLKCNFDVALALDAADYTDKVKPDIAIIASGDGDYVPLAERLRMRGIRVEVAATPAAISQDLMEAVNSFIDLSQMPDEDESVIEEAVAETVETVEEV